MYSSQNAFSSLLLATKTRTVTAVSCFYLFREVVISEEAKGKKNWKVVELSYKEKEKFIARIYLSL